MDTRVVYSTDAGRVCPDCGQPVARCCCRQIKKTIPQRSDGTVRISYEVKGRKGKGMTVIAGLPLSEADLTSISKELKQRFGTGGTVKEGAIELQGDHREQARGELEKRGYVVK